MAASTGVRPSKRNAQKAAVAIAMVANGASINQAARETGAGVSSVCGWVALPENYTDEHLQASNRHFVQRLDALQDAALGVAARKIDEASPLQATTIFAIARDKQQLITGGPTERVEHVHDAQTLNVCFASVYAARNQGAPPPEIVMNALENRQGQENGVVIESAP